MIVSASYRTDIPAFFADWFRVRLSDGYCEVRNPYGGRAYRVDLRAPDDGGSCDGFVFWTRNSAPFAGVLDELAAASRPFVVQFTVTGYPRALDAHTLRTDDTVAQILRLARAFGPRSVVWRYDPVLLTSLTPPAWHRETAARLAAHLAGSVDECTVSFANIYKKTRRRLEESAKMHEFSWSDPKIGKKAALLAEIAAINCEFGIRTTVCSQPEVISTGSEAFGVVSNNLSPARCIDAERLSDVAGFAIGARQKGNREGCLCAESRDIGAYDSCAHGCAYCYAVTDHDRAAAQVARGAPG